LLAGLSKRTARKPPVPSLQRRTQTQTSLALVEKTKTGNSPNLIVRNGFNSRETAFLSRNLAHRKRISKAFSLAISSAVIFLLLARRFALF